MEDQFPDEHLFAMTVETPWYANVTNYMEAGKLLAHLSSQENNLIVQRSAQFSWIEEYIFHTKSDLQIHTCIREEKIYDILKSFLDDPYGGNFFDRRIGHKILQMGYYWPIIFKDAKNYIHNYDNFQRMGRLIQAEKMPLQMQIVLENFEIWALEFLGPFNPPSNKKVYILVYTDYVNKWVEVVALSKDT